MTEPVFCRQVAETRFPSQNVTFSDRLEQEREEEEARLEEERIKKEQEEYEAMKCEFEIEEEGEDAKTEEQEAEEKRIFVTYIKVRNRAKRSETNNIFRRKK